MNGGIINLNGIPNSILDKKADKETMKTELAKKANISHEHSADDIKSGTLPIARGGTGATTAANARTNLGAFSSSGGTINGNVKITGVLEEGTNTTAGGLCSHAEGTNTTASGQSSHAEGSDTIANGKNSHAEGTATIAASYYSHAEGIYTVAGIVPILKISSVTASSKTFVFDTTFPEYADAFAKLSANMKIHVTQNYPYSISCEAYVFTIATVSSANHSCTVKETVPSSGFMPTYAVITSQASTLTSASHAEGFNTIAIGKNSHAEGNLTAAVGDNSHAEGSNTKANALYSHAEGKGATASGNYSHAEGDHTTASESASHAEGSRTKASATNSHAEGSGATASGNGSHAEGYNTQASAYYAHAEGSGTIASDWAAHAEGNDTIASGSSSHAGGKSTIASGIYQTAIGMYNKESNTHLDIFIIGNGSEEARSNCFRVTTKDGVFANSAYNSKGADYAEYFQWKDNNTNNEDRIGLFVTLDGDKICLATPEDDYILGIISSAASVIGDSCEDQWYDMYKTDIYNRPILEEVEIPEKTEQITTINENGEEITETIVIEKAHTEIRQVLNPEYDSTQEYIPRSKRPEWATVGMMGKLVVIDDGSCEVNGWCKVGQGGIAIKSEQKTRFRVMKRLDENHIKVLML